MDVFKNVFAFYGPKINILNLKNSPDYLFLMTEILSNVLNLQLYLDLWSVLSEDFTELIKYVNYTTES